MGQAGIPSLQKPDDPRDGRPVDLEMLQKEAHHRRALLGWQRLRLSLYRLQPFRGKQRQGQADGQIRLGGMKADVSAGSR